MKSVAQLACLLLVCAAGAVAAPVAELQERTPPKEYSDWFVLAESDGAPAKRKVEEEPVKRENKGADWFVLNDKRSLEERENKGDDWFVLNDKRASEKRENKGADWFVLNDKRSLEERKDDLADWFVSNNKRSPDKPKEDIADWFVSGA